MPAELHAVLEKHRYFGAVELVEPRIRVDVNLLELHSQPAQGLRHLFAEMAVDPAV